MRIGWRLLDCRGQTRSVLSGSTCDIGLELCWSYRLLPNMKSAMLEATSDADTLYVPSNSAARIAETFSMRTSASVMVILILPRAHEAWTLAGML